MSGDTKFLEKNKAGECRGENRGATLHRPTGRAFLIKCYLSRALHPVRENQDDVGSEAGSRDSKCKGPEVGTSLMYVRTVCVAAAGNGGRKSEGPCGS